MTDISIKQGDIVIINFDPSKGTEIRKRRPALVLSKDTYNKLSSLIIVCPITSTSKERPFLVPIENESLDKNSQVNTMQVYSLDKTHEGNRNIKVIGRVKEVEFLAVTQRFLLNFDFPFYSMKK